MTEHEAEILRAIAAERRACIEAMCRTCAKQEPELVEGRWWHKTFTCFAAPLWDREYALRRADR